MWLLIPKYGVVLLFGAITAALLLGMRAAFRRLASWRRPLVIGALALPAAFFGSITVDSIKGAVRATAALQSSSVAQDASAFLGELPDGDNQFVLLLRAFGHDGTHRFQTEYVPRLANTNINNRLVPVFSHIVRERLGLPTIALADPDALLAEKGPVYLRAGPTWRDDIQRLVQRSAMVVMLIHTHRGVTESMRREIEIVREAAIMRKLLIVLPAPENPKYPDSLAGLVSLSEMLPGLSVEPGRAPIFAYWDTQAERLHIVYSEYPPGVRSVNPLYLIGCWKEYTSTFFEAFERVAAVRQLKVYGASWRQSP